LRVDGARVVAFQGEHGAFSDDAATQLVTGATTRGYGTFDEVAAAVDHGEVDYAVLPVENSITGSIPRVYDLLWVHEALTVEHELVYRVVQNLIGTKGATLSGVREVRSHPVALEQCRTYLEAHPGWRSRIVSDTAGAVRTVVAEGDDSVAAIASRKAAERYRAQILAEAIQDMADNFTRFFLLRRTDRPAQSPNGNEQHRHACVALSLPNRPGSLRDALGAFADRSLNLRSLVSRPSQTGPFAYRFYCEVEASESDTLRAALAAIDGASRVLGQY
jgi:prephenate dehydratase